MVGELVIEGQDPGGGFAPVATLPDLPLEPIEEALGHPLAIQSGTGWILDESQLYEFRLGKRALFEKDPNGSYIGGYIVHNSIGRIPLKLDFVQSRQMKSAREKPPSAWVKGRGFIRERGCGSRSRLPGGFLLARG